jgi:hypothetical protein
MSEPARQRFGDKNRPLFAFFFHPKAGWCYI